MSQRSLRVGIVIDGQLVEERLFHDARPITFGQSLACALSIPIDGVPREHALFVRDQGTFQLRTTERMTGRVGAGERIDAIEPGAARTIPLARGTRGKLVLGPVTILFQEIATPPPAPRAQLPASIRGTLADRIDRRLAAIVGASLLVHVGIAAWAWASDVDTGVLGQPNIASEYHQDVIDVTLPDHVDRVDPTPIPQHPAVATPVAPQHQIVPTRTPGHASASDPQQLAEDARRMASILTGDDGAHGFGGMSQRTPGADLNHQIDDARNRTITIGDNGHTSRVDDHARIGTDNHGLPIDDPTLTHTDATHATERPGRIQITPVPGGDTGTTLTPQMVLDKIGSLYMAGLQRCYRLGQNEDASLEGKIRIELTVDEHGRVTDPAASGLTPKVDSCVQSFMSTWHFPSPHDKDGAPTDATFKISLVLKRG